MMNGEFDSRVTFTLLTDPGEDDDGSVDCDDVATAEINLRDCKCNSILNNLLKIWITLFKLWFLVKESPDLRDHLLDFVSTSSEAKILGQLLIDVSASEAIRALHIQWFYFFTKIIFFYSTFYFYAILYFFTSFLKNNLSFHVLFAIYFQVSVWIRVKPQHSSTSKNTSSSRWCSS